MIQILNKKTYKIFNFKKLNYFFLGIFSISVSIFYGYYGIFPIDSFLIFDSGYKVLNNIHPFKDYWSITGPILDYIQASLFYFFDVNWFSYTLHAAIINCLLTTLIFYFLNKLGLKSKISFIFAVCLALLAYPSTGTPFMDHHAVIFSLISLIFLILSIKNNKKKNWYLSSFFLVFSFFSKQIPSAYLVIFFLLVIFTNHIYFKNSKNIIYFIFGGVSALFFFILLFKFFDVPLNNFLVQYFFYPISIGENRILNINFDFKNTISQFKFLHFSILFLLASSIFSYFKNKEKIDFFILLIVIISNFIFIYTQIITKNQILIFFLIPFNLAISYFYFKKYYNKKLILLLIFLILLISTIKFHYRFNEGKKFIELENIDIKNNSINAVILDNKLKGLNWITRDFQTNPKDELEMLNNIKKLLMIEKNNKIIITDYQILSALIDSNFFTPNKWFDNLSVPDEKNKYFLIYKDFFISKLKEQKIKNVYIVGQEKFELFIVIFNDKKNCFTSVKINESLIVLDIENCY